MSLPQANCPPPVRSTPEFVTTVTTAVVNATVSGNVSSTEYIACAQMYIVCMWLVLTECGDKVVVCVLYEVCAAIGSGSSAVFGEENFAKRALSIKKYVDEDKDLQLRVLYALQIAVAKLQHPPGELDNGLLFVND